jgi:ketol-acid reductoisomerase
MSFPWTSREVGDIIMMLAPTQPAGIYNRHLEGLEAGNAVAFSHSFSHITDR